jgi:hypothetical protein
MMPEMDYICYIFFFDSKERGELGVLPVWWKHGFRIESFL